MAMRVRPFASLVILAVSGVYEEKLVPHAVEDAESDRETMLCTQVSTICGRRAA